jgi:hypothetical protein
MVEDSRWTLKRVRKNNDRGKEAKKKTGATY